MCNTLRIEYQKKPLRKKNPLMVAVKTGVPFTRIRQCTFCKKWFDSSKRTGTSCSDECFIKIKIVLNAGIHRQHYHGIDFDSGWEVEVAQLLDTLGIRWDRPKEYLSWNDSEGKERKCFPDFYLLDYDIYLDPKNPIALDKQKEKMAAISVKYDNVVFGDIDTIKAAVYPLATNQ